MISLSNSTISVNAPDGAIVGTLSDDRPGGPFVFSTAASGFTVRGSSLIAASPKTLPGGRTVSPVIVSKRVSDGAVITAKFAIHVARRGPVVQPPPPAPPGPTLKAPSLSSLTVKQAALSGDLVGNLSASGGKSPYQFSADNLKFSVVGSTLTRSASGALTAGVAETVNVTVMDAAGATATTAFIIAVQAVITPPTGVVGSLDPNKNELLMTNVSGAALTNYPLQIGFPSLQGNIPHFPQMLVNGVPVPTQGNVRNRFPDGSAAFAGVSAVVPSLANGAPIKLTFQDQPTANNTPVTQAQMLAFDDVQIRWNGAVVASSKQMLSAGHSEVIDGGPIATTVRLQDNSPARVYDFGGALRSVHPVMDVTFWPAISKAEVYIAFPNTNSTTLADVTGDLEVLIGGVSQHKWLAITISLATNLNKTFWIGGAPEKMVNLDQNIGYLASTKYLVNFDHTLKSAWAESDIAADYKAWTKAPKDLNDDGLWQSMNAPGARKDIGLHPGWMAEAAFTGDYRHREIMIGQADLAGVVRVHVTEGDPAKKYLRDGTVSALGRPLSMHAHPKDNLDGFEQKSMPTITLHSSYDPGHSKFQAAHQPEPFSMAYILTGKLRYLRSLQTWAAVNAMMDGVAADNLHRPSNPGTVRCASSPQGVIAPYSAEYRSNAWTRRNRQRAAFLSPDGSPERAYFLDLVNDWISFEKGQRGLPLSPSDSKVAWDWGKFLGGFFPLNYYMPQEVGDSVVTRNVGDGRYVHGSTDRGADFQATFNIDVLGEMKEKGFPGAAELLTWAAEWITGPLKQGALPGSDVSKLPFLYGVPLRDGVEHWAVPPPFPAGKVGGHGPYLTSWGDGGPNAVDTSPLLITAITQANPGVVTTAVDHEFTTGKKTVIHDSTPPAYNGSGVVTVIDARRFSIGVDTSTFAPYVITPTQGAADSQRVAPASLSVMNAITPSELTAYLSGFDGLHGDFGFLGYCASTFTVDEPHGKALNDWLKVAIRDKPRYVSNFVLGVEAGFAVAPRPPNDPPLPTPVP